jgi:hypothetical protein
LILPIYFEKTENPILVERQRYNEAVQEFNSFRANSISGKALTDRPIFRLFWTLVIINNIDKTITNLGSAYEVASALKYADALSVAEIARDHLRKIREKYSNNQHLYTRNDYDEAIKLLDNYLKKRDQISLWFLI